MAPASEASFVRETGTNIGLEPGVRTPSAAVPGTQTASPTGFWSYLDGCLSNGSGNAPADHGPPPAGEKRERNHQTLPVTIPTQAVTTPRPIDWHTDWYDGESGLSAAPQGSSDDPGGPEQVTQASTQASSQSERVSSELASEPAPATPEPTPMHGPLMAPRRDSYPAHLASAGLPDRSNNLALSARDPLETSSAGGLAIPGQTSLPNVTRQRTTTASFIVSEPLPAGAAVLAAQSVRMAEPQSTSIPVPTSNGGPPAASQTSALGAPSFASDAAAPQEGTVVDLTHLATRFDSILNVGRDRPVPSTANTPLAFQARLVPEPTSASETAPTAPSPVIQTAETQSTSASLSKALPARGNPLLDYSASTATSTTPRGGLPFSVRPEVPPASEDASNASSAPTAPVAQESTGLPASFANMMPAPSSQETDNQAKAPDLSAVRETSQALANWPGTVSSSNAQSTVSKADVQQTAVPRMVPQVPASPALAARETGSLVSASASSALEPASARDVLPVWAALSYGVPAPKSNAALNTVLPSTGTDIREAPANPPQAVPISSSQAAVNSAALSFTREAPQVSSGLGGGAPVTSGPEPQGSAPAPTVAGPRTLPQPSANQPEVRPILRNQAVESTTAAPQSAEQPQNGEPAHTSEPTSQSPHAQPETQSQAASVTASSTPSAPAVEGQGQAAPAAPGAFESAGAKTSGFAAGHGDGHDSKATVGAAASTGPSSGAGLPATTESDSPLPEAGPTASPQTGPARPTEPEPLPQYQPASHQVALRLNDGQSNVDIRLSERAGEIRVTVHTPDHDLANSLRADLPDLVGKLRQSGFQAEAWRPTGGATSDGDRRGNTDDRTGQQYPQGDRRGSRQPQSQQQQKNSSRWAGEWKSNLDPLLESQS